MPIHDFVTISIYNEVSLKQLAQGQTMVERLAQTYYQLKQVVEQTRFIFQPDKLIKFIPLAADSSARSTSHSAGEPQVTWYL